MNSAASCHEIPGCPGVFVDAFRGMYLKIKTQDERNVFILTHYHGDHYGSLPRGDGKKFYQGPAQIHCTPVTARLLRSVHGVPCHLVVEHKYGDSWTVGCHRHHQGRKRKAKQTDESASSNYKMNDDFMVDTAVTITFYDANHCPGAALVLFQLSDGTAHLHTGDFRFHKRMKSYPLLRDAAEQRRIDTVLLDTTYGHPKHAFCPQETAIDQIATQVQELIVKSQTRSTADEPGTENKTLVLLSCYSIGKERVLWEVSQRTNQAIGVTERKYRMLKCLVETSDDEETTRKMTNQIVHRCYTLCSTENNVDSTENGISTFSQGRSSDIHVIPMGLAGELWPYFRPNFFACADYAEKQQQSSNGKYHYNKVVAFIPTGWAEATNWNKKNAVSCCDCKGVQVEIRLVSYSEHSAFSELEEFVAFLKPRKIVPTVYKDENDKRRIEARFKVDSGRAKQFFFKSMTAAATTDHNELIQRGNRSKPSTSTSPISLVPSTPENEKTRQSSATKDSDSKPPAIKREGIIALEEMGFSHSKAATALQKANGVVETALNFLLSEQSVPVASPSPTGRTTTAGKRSSTGQGTPSIKSFFKKKQK